MEAIEKCLRFCGNFDGRVKKRKIYFFKEKEREKKNSLKFIHVTLRVLLFYF